MESSKQTTSENNSPKVVVATRKSSKPIVAIVSLVLLVVGGFVGLYLMRMNQDLRQQASDGPYNLGYECNLNDPNACNGHPERCHCLGGDACTGTECDDDIEDSCLLQGRAYCTNMHGQGTTCCVPGYECCPNSDGCCEGSGPTKPPKPTDPPEPTDPPITITVTPTNTPTPTPTPPLGCGDTPCETSADCGTGVGLSCVVASDGEGYCALPQYSTACAENPSVESCCTEPTPTTPITPTTPVGPQCMEISMYDLTNGQSQAMTADDDENLVAGQSTVRFVCASTDGPILPDGYFYAFRIYEPCGSGNHYTPVEFVNNEGENGVNYSISMSGDHMAQCAICEIDDQGDTVCGWESLTPAVCPGDLD